MMKETLKITLKYNKRPELYSELCAVKKSKPNDALQLKGGGDITWINA